MQHNALSAATLISMFFSAVAGAQELPVPEEQRFAESAAQREPAPQSKEEPDAADDYEGYARAGVIELGGRISTLWTEDRFELELSPSIGYFIADYVELSAIVSASYVNERDEDSGEREKTESYAFILEPSYHVPLREELYLFGGTGVGVGHDGDNFDFELIPRIGINTSITLQGVLSPSVSVPIIIDADGTTVGIGFDIGYTVAW